METNSQALHSPVESLIYKWMAMYWNWDLGIDEESCPRRWSLGPDSLGLSLRASES